MSTEEKLGFVATVLAQSAGQDVSSLPESVQQQLLDQARLIADQL
ncbi:MAG: hypothetical protein AAF191_05460 [Verrucomicrobiota bacterium]